MTATQEKYKKYFEDEVIAKLEELELSGKSKEAILELCMFCYEKGLTYQNKGDENV